ncbi:hypothetical protein BH09BAC1_BH09BAC1_08690 [soil metagenome]
MQSTFFLVFITALLLLASMQTRAQRPEQDCFGALSVCQTIYTQNTSYNGRGTNQEILNRPGTCMITGENNSVWYIFTVSTAGNLEFALTPISSNDDYDFSLFNLTGYSCLDIPNGRAPEVRCNFAVTTGVATGISSSGTATSAGPNGDDFLTSLPVQVGETYVLVVDNFTKNGKGYTLDFSAGTAGIADTVEPFVDSVVTLTCDTTRFINIYFSEPVDCSTILANGSQFAISGPQTVNIIGAVGIDCAGLQKFTTGIRLQLAAPILVGGTYWFKSIPGTGGLSVLDVCGRAVVNDSASMLAPSIVLPHFTYNISASCVVDTLHFINNSVPNTSNGSPIWDWNFGDSSPHSTQQHPAHVFPDTVLYNVRLTATTNSGCSYTWDSVLPVDRSYNALFIYAPTAICPGAPVQFTDVSPASADRWEWDFGDNTTSGDENPIHTYATSGTYTVTLVVSEPSAIGLCSDTTRQTVLVLPDVDAAFTISASQICEGAPVVFTDQTTGYPSTWHWDFDNGDTSNIQNPRYTFDSAGIFSITLTVSNGCNTDNISQRFEVFAIPVFNLGRDTAICFDRAVTLYGYPGATTMIWSTGQTGDSILVVGAPIEVRASASNNGCTYDDAIIIDELQEGCIIVPVPSAFTPNNDGSNDVWRLVNPQRLLSMEVWIINRWGQVVFYDDQLNFAWDGKYKDEPAEMGVYSYILRGFGESSRGKEPVYYRGNLTLVR